MECLWRISNLEDYFILLEFRLLNLDRLDEVVIGLKLNAQVILIVKNSTKFPKTLTINETNAWIRFNSDQDGRAGGFIITIWSKPSYGDYWHRFLDLDSLLKFYAMYCFPINIIHFFLGKKVKGLD